MKKFWIIILSSILFLIGYIGICCSNALFMKHIHNLPYHIIFTIMSLFMTTPCFIYWYNYFTDPFSENEAKNYGLLTNNHGCNDDFSGPHCDAIINMTEEWQYGTCNAMLARKHRIKGNVQMRLWKAGQQGHKDDYWHDFDSSWWSEFIPI